MDEAASIKLARCKLHKFNPWRTPVRGVQVHSSCTADLSSLSISCPKLLVGVEVRTCASATLIDCTVSHSRQACVAIGQQGAGRVECCTMSESENWGLHVHDLGSRADATHCHVLRNDRGGMHVNNGGCITADTCTSSDNVCAGFRAEGDASVIEITSCTSQPDGSGCTVRDGVKLTARKMVVSESRGGGFFLLDLEEESVLRECTTTKCEDNGVYAARCHTVDAKGCTFQDNGGCGVRATRGAVVMRGCRSSQNKGEGYKAVHEAKMKVINSLSDGDKQGCGISHGGELTMEAMIEYGVCQSGTLP